MQGWQPSAFSDSIGAVPNPDRLSAVETSFLRLDRGTARMHGGACLLLDGDAPPYDELVAHVTARLDRAPRLRQRPAEVPLAQGRPVWVDDPRFDPCRHIRHAALPDPTSTGDLRALAAEVFSERLDPGAPLWELWLVERAGAGGFALIAKVHQALAGQVDLVATVLDREPAPRYATPREPWRARPVPSAAALLADAVGDGLRAQAAAARRVARDLRRVADAAAGLGALLGAGVAPPSPLTRPPGPRRRFTWVEADLARARASAKAVDATLEDVVLAAVAGALRDWYRRHGWPTQAVTLRALAPACPDGTAPVEEARYAPLPLWAVDPLERLVAVRDAMAAPATSELAAGAGAMARLAELAPPPVLAGAARWQERQRLVNLTVATGPEVPAPRYLLGRPVLAIHPQAPLAANSRLAIAAAPFDGRLSVGLLGDFDALADLDVLAAALRAAFDDLSGATGVARVRPFAVLRGGRGD